MWTSFFQLSLVPVNHSISSSTSKAVSEPPLSISFYPCQPPLNSSTSKASSHSPSSTPREVRSSSTKTNSDCLRLPRCPKNTLMISSLSRPSRSSTPTTCGSSWVVSVMSKGKTWVSVEWSSVWIYPSEVWRAVLVRERILWMTIAQNI